MAARSLVADRDSLRIEHAAILHNGKLYLGKRHAEIMQRIWNETVEPEFISQEEQGFVDSTGRFLSRFQAGAVAFRAGQTETRREHLLSEHLW